MKNVARKLLMIMMVALMLTAFCGIYASALTAGEAADKVDSLFLDDIKEHMDWMNQKVKGFYAGFANLMPLLFGVILLVLCFFGYRMLKPLNLVGGMYLGFAVGVWLFEFLSQKMVMPGAFVKIILGAFLAIILGLLCTALNKASVIVYLTGHAFYFAATQITDNLIVCVALAAIALVIAIFMFKYVFIHIFTLKCATAGVALLFRSPMIADAVDFSKFITIADKEVVLTFIALLIALFGILTQMKLARKRR